MWLLCIYNAVDYSFMNMFQVPLNTYKLVVAVWFPLVLSHAGFYRLHHRESELSNLFLPINLNSWSALLPFPEPLSILLYPLWDAETRTAYRIQGVGQRWICTAALRCPLLLSQFHQYFRVSAKHWAEIFMRLAIVALISVFICNSQLKGHHFT